MKTLLKEAFLVSGTILFWAAVVPISAVVFPSLILWENVKKASWGPSGASPRQPVTV
jgi:hypothetical protein